MDSLWWGSPKTQTFADISHRGWRICLEPCHDRLHRPDSMVNGF